jgi:hypothetical protein
LLPIRSSLGDFNIDHFGRFRSWFGILSGDTSYTYHWESRTVKDDQGHEEDPEISFAQPESAYNDNLCSIGSWSLDELGYNW